MARDSLTVAISSYQRREPLLRLLRGLDRQVAAIDDLRSRTRVVVVLDGSTDGSREAVEAQAWTMPVEVIWQPNRGLAAARNVGLRAAGDGLVWLLDDDLVLPEGLAARHLAAHGSGAPSVMIGPCHIPPESHAPRGLRDWWDEFYREPTRTGRVDRFDLFTAANASAPASVFLEAGGFDEQFVTYGLEDAEMGLRLISQGTSIRFDADAFAWHPDVPSMSLLIRRQRDIGRSIAVLVGLHPETTELLLPAPDGRLPKSRRILRRLRLRSPRAFMVTSRIALLLWRATRPVAPGKSRFFENLARAAAHASGLATGDPTGRLIARLLRYPEPVADGS